VQAAPVLNAGLLPHAMATQCSPLGAVTPRSQWRDLHTDSGCAEVPPGGRELVNLPGSVSRT
jgi:hypothetical protein